MIKKLEQKEVTLLYKGKHSENQETVNIYKFSNGFLAVPDWWNISQDFLMKIKQPVFPNYPKPGQKFRHFKGNNYEVLCLAQWENTCKIVVVYRALYGEGQIWVRPLEMFLGQKEINGTCIDRFTLIS